METLSVSKKPHAICIPLPFQSHINAMLKLAKILHSKGFHITFVNTEFNHQRILMSRGPDSLKGLPDFRFETIPDCLPPHVINATQDQVAFMDSVTTNGLVHVRSLIAKLNESSAHDPPVSCIVSDGTMTCTLEAAEELGVPQVLLWPMSALVLMSYFHGQQIVEKGLFPLKDESYSTNGYMDTPVDFLPGVENIRLKDLPSLFWDGNDKLKNIVIREVQRASKASAIILNTFDALESEVLNAMKLILPDIYTMGPLYFLEQQIPKEQWTSFGSNLLEEHQGCLQWLDSKLPDSVVYVNFGSSTVMTQAQLIEFAWGLANCKHPFLWVIRPDLVMGEAAVLPPEFIKETTNRSMISGWCPQEKVLSHSSTGGFLTHCGWNSMMDTMCSGVPIISWPFISDQQTNCRNASVLWGIGMEIDKNVRRDDVERLVRELMEGDKGKEMKKKAMEWKKSAEASTKPGALLIIAYLELWDCFSLRWCFASMVVFVADACFLLAIWQSMGCRWRHLLHFGQSFLGTRRCCDDIYVVVDSGVHAHTALGCFACGIWLRPRVEFPLLFKLRFLTPFLVYSLTSTISLHSGCTTRKNAINSIKLIAYVNKCN